MHDNSLNAYSSLTDLSARQTRVYKILQACGAMTDRQVLEALRGQDMNLVRPRITELIKAKWVREIGRERCHLTGRAVRKVRAVSEAERLQDSNQMELAIPFIPS